MGVTLGSSSADGAVAHVGDDGCAVRPEPAVLPPLPSHPPGVSQVWRGYPGWVLLGVIVGSAVLVLDVASATTRGLPLMRAACWLIGIGVVAQTLQWLWLIGPGRHAP